MADRSSQEEARNLLKKYWGFDQFRAGQWEIIEQVLAGKDALAILPTGGGKSLCYQVPALMLNGITLVISPLIALMQDQVQRLEAMGVKASYINSTLNASQIDQRWTDIEHGRYDLVYIAPERLQSELFLARAERLNIKLIAVDEAHCISEWGYDFRPAYLKIAEVRPMLPGIPVLALTATATPPVREDIRSFLELKQPFELVNGFNRPNLTWSIFHVENKKQKVQDVLKGVPGTGVIYAATRSAVEEWQQWLERQGIAASAYHGGMSAGDRERSAAAWTSGATRIMVATNAFGMGIDKANVRFVIHVSLPGALESYYQEAGRAGRDGQRAHAVLLYRAGDEDTQEGLIQESHPDKKKIQAIYEAICQQERIAVGDFPHQPVIVHMDEVARKTQSSISAVRVTIDLLIEEGYWTGVRGKQFATMIQFLQPAASVRNYMKRVKNEKVVQFVETLLRTVHADAFTDWWEVDLRMLERKTGLPMQRILDGFAFLEQRELIGWLEPGRQMRLVFAKPRARNLLLDTRSRDQAKKRALTRLKDMLRYTHSVSCRRHFLLKYFGEESPEQCGTCDICLGRHDALVITPEDEPRFRQILKYIRDDVPKEHWFAENVSEQRRSPDLIAWLYQEAYLESVNLLEERYRLTDKAEQMLKEWEPGERGE